MDIYRKSKQRDRIMEILKENKLHPTADWIYKNLKKEFPNLSLGNVYRNLNILIEQKKISKIVYGSTFDRYDANIDKHYHFICKECNKIIDLDVPIDDEINKKVTDYQVVDHKIEFYGYCKNCKVK